MTVASGNDRLFCDTYSATSQREVLSDGESSIDDFTALLRLDVLAARTIVIPDVHVFDGWYFQRRSPEQVTTDIGRGVRDPVLPLEIRARSSRLEEALVTLLRLPDADHLTDFVFNTISDPAARDALAEELWRTPAALLDRSLRGADRASQGVARLVRDVLRGLGFAEELVDPLEQGWDRWIAAPTVSVRRWDAPFDLADAVRRDPIAPSDLFTDRGKHTLRRIRSSGMRGEPSSRRARVSTILRDARKSRLNAEEALDLVTAEHWYTQARHRAIALQHHCSHTRTEPMQMRPVSPLRKLVATIDEGTADLVQAEARIDLPDDFLSRLAILDGEDFRKATHLTERHLEAWWRTGDIHALKQSVAVILEASGETVRVQPRAIITQLFAGFAGSVASGAAAGQSPALADAIGPLVAAIVTAAAPSPESRSARRRVRRVTEYLVARTHEGTN